MRDPLLIANASGFYGDRFSAPEEMVLGGPLHVLTGDYLAEVTMAILHRARRKDPRLGYATTFLAQLERVLGACLERGIRVVTNAGGLNPAGLAEAVTRLAAKLGRFSARVVELALASVPGIKLGAPPKDATPEIGTWPCLVGLEHVQERVHLDGESIAIPPPPEGPAGGVAVVEPGSAPEAGATEPAGGRPDFGARSGDKGENATLGVWAQTPGAYAILRETLDVARLKALLPEIAPYPVDRSELPNLRAVMFVIRGFLQGGATSSARVDPQAKTLGEYLRARVAATWGR